MLKKLSYLAILMAIILLAGCNVEGTTGNVVKCEGFDPSCVDMSGVETGYMDLIGAENKYDCIEYSFLIM